MDSAISRLGLSALKSQPKPNSIPLRFEQTHDTLLLQSNSPSMRRLLEDARQAACSEGTVLLIGERNTGRSILARQIHLWSSRCRRPFISFNCTTQSEHVEGSHRPFLLRALEQRARLSTEEFEMIKGGTLFIANVEDLPIPLQVSLANFVQTRTFETQRKLRRVDIRIVASASRGLHASLAQHKFREDLFYALNVLPLTVPALRERCEDILPLARTMLDSVAEKRARGKLSLSPEAAALLTRYHWPGNIRELRNAVEAAAVFCKEGTITTSLLPEALSRSPHIQSNSTSSVSLNDLERAQIILVLRQSRTLKEAATTLGISQSTLWRKRARFGVDFLLPRKAKPPESGS